MSEPKYTNYLTEFVAMNVAGYAVVQTVLLLWQQVLPWESALVLLVWMASLVGATYMAVRDMPRSLIKGVLTGDAKKQLLSELVDRLKLGTADDEDDESTS